MPSATWGGAQDAGSENPGEDRAVRCSWVLEERGAESPMGLTAPAGCGLVGSSRGRLLGGPGVDGMVGSGH